VTEMTQSAPVSRLRSEYDAFLFASIGDERNGSPLSVLSAMARLDLDPWLEAARLSGMPREAAIERIALLTVQLPESPLGRPDAATIASRLIALLPRPNSSHSAPGGTGLGVGGATDSRTIAFVILMALALGAQFFVTSRQPPAQVENVGARTSSAASPQVQPASTGQ
jgi:hypothetical protein